METTFVIGLVLTGLAFFILSMFLMFAMTGPSSLVPASALLGTVCTLTGICFGGWVDFQSSKAYSELAVERKLSEIVKEMARRGSGEAPGDSYLARKTASFSDAGLHAEESALRRMIETAERARRMESVGYELPSDLSAKLETIEKKLNDKRSTDFDETLSEMTETELKAYAAVLRERLERAEEFARKLEREKRLP